MLNNNIQKNAISKAKSQLFIQKRRSRDELASLTKSQRSSIYDHRSRYSKLNKAKRIARFLVSGSKNMSFYLLMTVPTEKKRQRSNDIYIYNNNSYTKNINNYIYVEPSKTGGYCMSNWATMNANNIFNEKNSDVMSDNAYSATIGSVKKPYSTYKSQSRIQSETKNRQGESSKPIAPKKLFPKALLGRARDIWELAQQNRISKFRAKRDLARCKEDFPEGIDLFTQWYNSGDGNGFKQWITQ